MRKSTPIVFIFLLVVMIGTGYAATITGVTYDFSLEKIARTHITINTEPRQQFITENATYIFKVPEGVYQLTARQIDHGVTVAQTEENITIRGDGTFRVDLILFPDFSKEEELLEARIPIDETLDQSSAQAINGALIGTLLVIVVLLVVIARKIKNPHIKEGSAIEKLPDDLQKLIEFLKSHQGRATQKWIRGQFPQSEAKISLMIADLEQRGIIQKIKKGRGNIILLK